MSEQLEWHYELMNSGRWRVDRSDPSGEVFYEYTGGVHPQKMIIEDAIKVEQIIKEWANDGN